MVWVLKVYIYSLQAHSELHTCLSITIFLKKLNLRSWYYFHTALESGKRQCKAYHSMASSINTNRVHILGGFVCQARSKYNVAFAVHLIYSFFIKTSVPCLINALQDDSREDSIRELQKNNICNCAWQNTTPDNVMHNIINTLKQDMVHTAKYHSAVISESSDIDTFGSRVPLLGVFDFSCSFLFYRNITTSKITVPFNTGFVYFHCENECCAHEYLILSNNSL